MTLPEVVVGGNRRASLEALRDLLAESLVEAPVGQRAPLAKQLTEVLRDLDDMATPEGSKLDDLAARRAARLADATGTDST